MSASQPSAGKSLGSRRSLRSVRSSATSIGSAPFYFPRDDDDDDPSSTSQPVLPPPTDADAKGWHAATAPLDFEAWPWKATVPEKRGSRGPRIFADQEWRKTKVEQIRASENSFREWAEDLTGEELGATAKDADRTADVTFGVWSCCKALPLLSSGCVGSQHTAEWALCAAPPSYLRSSCAPPSYHLRSCLVSRTPAKRATTASAQVL